MVDETTMWERRQLFKAVPGYLVAMIAGAIFMTWINSRNYSPEFDATRYMDIVNGVDINKQLIIQRNSISKMLNNQQQRIGALQCKMNDAVNERGGYCRKEAIDQLARPLIHAELFDKISVYLKGKTAASFGEGGGVYTKRMIESGHLTKVAAYDGNPFCNETSEGRVQFLDLSVSQYGLPVYDWIISIEVAEHIPAQFEHTYLDNIARHAREGVILSWAVPGQDGVAHVNCRPFSYVKKRMAEVGFSHDEATSIQFRNNAQGNLQRNLNFFIRVDHDQAIDIFS